VSNQLLSIEGLEHRLGRIPRVRLGLWPTPLEQQFRLSAAWGGPDVLVKRDDLSGLALGGNKVRNLEFRMANALFKGCDVVVMAREQYSNNARQTAAAAAKLGLRMVLLVPSEEAVEIQGNRLLEEIVGAEVRVIRTTDPAEIKADVREAVQSEIAAGHHPYDNDAEDPNAFGVLGYVAGAVELVRQCDRLDLEPGAVYMAAGNSQAGLVLGLRLLGRAWPVVGAAVEMPGSALRPRQHESIARVAAMLGVEDPTSDADFDIQDAPLGEGFQRITPEARDVTLEAGRLEGLILDPVYTAKAAACLRSDVAAGRWPRGSKVIFIHTGGVPALFSMPGDILAAYAEG
jgi:1-aminocyclopropane-1-carboxylate deaminase/D-cysteine desulfhydrase-like pyridoxal-dependent ACC family enzyme